MFPEWKEVEVLSKPTGRRRLGRPRRKSKDNVRRNLKEIGNDRRNRVDSALDKDYYMAHVNAKLNLRVP